MNVSCAVESTMTSLEEHLFRCARCGFTLDRGSLPDFSFWKSKMCPLPQVCLGLSCAYCLLCFYWV